MHKQRDFREQLIKRFYGINWDLSAEQRRALHQIIFNALLMCIGFLLVIPVVVSIWIAQPTTALLVFIYADIIFIFYLLFYLRFAGRSIEIRSSDPADAPDKVSALKLVLRAAIVSGIMYGVATYFLFAITDATTDKVSALRELIKWTSLTGLFWRTIFFGSVMGIVDLWRIRKIH